MKSHTSKLHVHWRWGLLGVSAGLVLLWLWKNTSPWPRKAQEGTFWLVVEITFESEAHRQTFEEAFQELAHYVERHEPNTLTYQVARSDKDPLKVIVFERYLTKDDYILVHRSSEPFLKFRPQLAALEPVITGHSYYESDLGYAI